MALNQTQYAAHRKKLGLAGGHLNSVQNAIKSGRLDGALTPDRKAIADVALADKLWESNTRHNRRPKAGPTAVPAAQPAQAKRPRTGEGSANWREAPSNPPTTDVAEASADVPPIAESLARKEAANAELAERKLAADKGAFIEVALVRREQLKENAEIQTRLLAIPSQLAQYLSREEHRRIAPIVKKVIRAALEQLADEDTNE